ncbi:hypothetical protein RclHR1_01290004 [Rhizophagus clarus]|uniref:Protein kinase domain-containing protein n=1 Tax=Rhizophagus clarus TaxID=94130 RepID=A0A2Z6Q8D2_9GLOM|nr:hypothetical protein RclHR1_01290004 [Rhizophagus clarus]
MVFNSGCYNYEQHIILTDESLTENEKSEAIRITNKTYDLNKLIFNHGTKRICENCNQECLAITYCEHCVRNYLKANFSNWTSGNDIIDNLIHECQMKTFSPDGISEWIPYNNLKNTKYLTKGGFSEIYTATWTNGRYEEWDPKEQQLKRIGEQMVVLKKLENFENANQSWLEEARSHLTISNKWPEVVQCYGLTQEPSNESYMLVMSKLDIDLRKYLQQNHNQLTWKEKIQITFDIIYAVIKIHNEKVIHRDLHSGNILFKNNRCDISDLGFCGPADKPLKSICGNLPYLAPEVIIGKGHTFKSDIYSIAMLMWEISSGQPSFINYEHDYYLAMNIVNGIRPKFVSGTPLEYKNLMKQFWDADPLKRPDIFALMDKINEINLSYLKSNESLIQQEENNSFEITEDHTSSSKLSTSKLHYFENLPEPRNATEEEQEAFHSNKSYNFHVPNNIDDFNKLSSKKNSMGSIFKDIKNDNKIEAIQQQTKKYHNIRDNDEDEIFNNPNLHSEEQDELVLPDNI